MVLTQATILPRIDHIVEATLPHTTIGVFKTMVEEITVLFQSVRFQLVIGSYREGTIASGSYEDSTVVELEDAADTGNDALGEIVVNETVMYGIKAVKSMVGANPKSALTVTKQLDHHIDRQGGGIRLVMKIGNELIAVKPVQAVVGGYPDGTLPVLTEAGDKTTGESVGRIEVSCLRIRNAEGYDTEE